MVHAEIHHLLLRRVRSPVSDLAGCWWCYRLNRKHAQLDPSGHQHHDCRPVDPSRIDGCIRCCLRTACVGSPQKPREGQHGSHGAAEIEEIQILLMV